MTPLPLPPPIQKKVDELGADASRTVQQLGGDTLTTIKKAAGDTVRTLQKANGDAFATIQKAGEDTISTTYKAAGDAAATYVKGWRDVGDQGKRSFDDAIDAGKAVEHFVENQAKAEVDAANNAAKRLRDGKVVDAMWGLGTEPLKSDEENFAKATQESKVINAAAATAAATYGGPAGAAAYAAWSTYRQTGNADMAIRAGLLAAVTSQTGSSIGQMPAGTTGEIIKKAAMAGAAGGVAVAAAGGDEQAIRDGFLKSAGAVVVQAGTDKLKAYSPEAQDAYESVQCISARDIDCLTKTTWARDAEGKILTDETTGEPRFDTSEFDPDNYIGKWSRVDPQSVEGQVNAVIAQTSKLPKTEAIPILDNKWVLTWTLGKEKYIKKEKPTVVLTYVGEDPPFVSTTTYGDTASSEAASRQPAVEDARPDTGDKLVAYYEKPADRKRVIDALEKNSIEYTKLDYVGPEHARALSNALICGPNTRISDLKKVALSLMRAGIDIKYIGTKSTNKPGQISILNLQKKKYTINTPNITRKQINELTSCPSSLKNY
ncbi:hypothetical protein EOA23_00890 [Mesorhizobium sp. M2A.F.Ca.ET.042.01.1.1]|uniref:hypothetical protein n=1 Tax=Mesorhizobium sp. M2A.F.Ca.ET.042.01.1.1 TaxID=2496745 RepID=UPI000FCA9832|nr:hypothetical protein [Mesorhizobium sp. M2A.F.Ca.ET.042.01.1.1]RUX34636.1 hypothetical protein EOA23_00890 [Mesorhizobium sp. M2A.F.Ca.ET.042.01.1.1]